MKICKPKKFFFFKFLALLNRTCTYYIEAGLIRYATKVVHVHFCEMQLILRKLLQNDSILVSVWRDIGRKLLSHHSLTMHYRIE